MKTKLTCLRYLGYTSMDKRFSNAMLPWLLREIRRMGIRDKLSVAIEDGYLKGYNQNFEPVIVHRLVDIIRACQVPGRPEELLYLLVNDKDSLLYCYLFRAENASEVTDLFTQMREPSPAVPSPRGSTTSLNANVTKNVGFQNQTSNEHLPWTTPSISLPRNCNLNLSTDIQSPLIRSTSNASSLTTTLTSLSANLSPSESHFFEVLYIGKVKISQRKVPDTLIDDALHKFSQHEAEKAKINQLRRNSLLSSQGTTLSSSDSKEDFTEDIKKTEIRASEYTNTKLLNLNSTSTTPLEPDKTFAWKSVDNITETTKNKLEQISKTKPILEDEFEAFTKERIERRTNNNNIRKPNPTPLEPTVLILNVPPKKNLTTLPEDEEKTEDLNTVLANTAASITEFYKNNPTKDGTPTKDANANDIKAGIFKENNPFLADIKKEEINKNIKREDSPSPSLNFNEIPRKPKMFLRSKSGLDAMEVKKNSMPENKPFLRDRSASIGTLSIKTPLAQLIGEQNRTMLFQVGRSELRLISPDRKQILLHRGFKDVASCVLGRLHEDHFGFVCRDTGVEGYACYVFKCESHSVAQEVVGAIKQAFISHAELLKKTRDKPTNMTCEHCPMLWYHRLCHDIEGMNEKKIHAFILRRIEQLGDDEQEQIVTKYQGGTNHMYEVSEHNAFLMMLLRAHCEAKQQRHVHDTAENRSEFLNQYLGGSTIFMKAKRSLSSGFDHLLKRKASKDEGSMQTLNIKKEQSPGPINDSASEPAMPGGLVPPEVSLRSKSLSPGIPSQESPPSPTNVSGPIPTSESDVTINDQSMDDNCKSPMMEIFLKVSDSRSSDPSDDNEQQQSTWRQAIYQKVIQTPDNVDEELSPENILNLQPAEIKSRPGKRTKDELRQLWKMAIDQTVLLVRMEKENARLQQSEESSAVRRIKLEYMELGTVDAGVTLMWDSMLASRNHQISKVDHHMLTQAVIQGVPRMYRGNIWYFLAEQACLRSPPLDQKRFPQYNTPYHSLLSGLTKYQHAILIDLGRTFPQHSYFASALGPGQLALYNILKAYSLLDPDVGYCQGLSFVAATLLLHMEEAEAFTLLRHLMIRRGLRKQYLPDMSALQVQLYQLSRLLRDHEPDLHAKLESLDISPALYAAPWMLTLFTSQFPLGFVVRIFDLIFLQSLDIVFAVSLALLSVHKDGIMLCESCEEGAEYLKHKLPDIDQKRYNKVMKKVHSLDISRQLTDYAVEYAVLREEMPRVANLTTNNKKLLKDNNKMSLELDSAMEAMTKYQNSQIRLENQIKLMDHQLVMLSKFLTTHHRTDLPIDLKKITQNYTKKTTFGSKITSFSSKFTSNDEEEEKTFKTGVSSPNLFAKVNKDDILNAAHKEKSKISPESDKRTHFIMKKSQSVHSGLKANNLKHTLKVLEEKGEIDTQNKQFVKDLFNAKRGSKNSHEQIEQERMFEQQLKHDFDENLKRLDAKLITNDITEDDDDIFRNKKSLSLNFSNKREDIKSLTDSGFVTPLTPNDNLKRDDMSVVSHPLSDCDVDIKFDGQLTKLKQIRPMLKQRTHSVDEFENKNA